MLLIISHLVNSISKAMTSKGDKRFDRLLKQNGIDHPGLIDLISLEVYDGVQDTLDDMTLDELNEAKVTANREYQKMIVLLNHANSTRKALFNDIIAIQERIESQKEKQKKSSSKQKLTQKK